MLKNKFIILLCSFSLLGCKTSQQKAFNFNKTSLVELKVRIKNINNIPSHCGTNVYISLYKAKTIRNQDILIYVFCREGYGEILDKELNVILDKDLSTIKGDDYIIEDYTEMNKLEKSKLFKYFLVKIKNTKANLVR